MDIYIKNLAQTIGAEPGITFQELFGKLEISLKSCPLCALANGKLCNLSDRIYDNADVEYLDATDSFGARVYTLGLVFVLSKAVRELFPDGKVSVSNAVSKGIYCKISIGKEVDYDTVSAINERMGSIIGRNIPFEHHKAHTSEVIELMKGVGRDDVAVRRPEQRRLLQDHDRVPGGQVRFRRSLLRRGRPHGRL